MIASLFQSSNIPVLQEVLSFTESRHNVLAGNVANMDTPGYQVRDLSVDNFQQLLREALEAPAAAGRVESMGYEGPRISSRDERLGQVRDSLQSILLHDGSNVGLEQQVLELSKNQMMHNLAISIMTSQFRLLQAAVSERV